MMVRCSSSHVNEEWLFLMGRSSKELLLLKQVSVCHILLALLLPSGFAGLSFYTKEFCYFIKRFPRKLSTFLFKEGGI